MLSYLLVPKSMPNCLYIVLPQDTFRPIESKSIFMGTNRRSHTSYVMHDTHMSNESMNYEMKCAQIIRLRFLLRRRRTRMHDYETSIWIFGTHFATSSTSINQSKYFIWIFATTEDSSRTFHSVILLGTRWVLSEQHLNQNNKF